MLKIWIIQDFLENLFFKDDKHQLKNRMDCSI